VGDVESKFAPEASGLISELAEGGARELDIALAPGAVERLLAYSRSVAHFPTAVKEVCVCARMVCISWDGINIGMQAMDA